jgi:hypothetical protein
LQFLITGKRLQESGGEGSVNPLKKFEEDQANRIALALNAIAARMEDFLDPALGPAKPLRTRSISKTRRRFLPRSNGSTRSSSR